MIANRLVQAWSIVWENEKVCFCDSSRKPDMQCIQDCASRVRRIAEREMSGSRHLE
jgi:hypothetical protein